MHQASFHNAQSARVRSAMIGRWRPVAIAMICLLVIGAPGEATKKSKAKIGSGARSKVEVSTDHETQGLPPRITQARGVVLEKQLGKPLTDKIVILDVRNPALKNACLVPVLNTWTVPSELVFYLLAQKDVVFPLADVRGPNRKWEFRQLVDVRVEDVNRDGYQDVLVLARFAQPDDRGFLYSAVYLNDQRAGFVWATPARVSTPNAFQDLASYALALRGHFTKVGMVVAASSQFELPTDGSFHLLFDSWTVAASVSRQGGGASLGVVVREGKRERWKKTLRAYETSVPQLSFIEVQLIAKRWVGFTFEESDCARVLVVESSQGRTVADSDCRRGEYCSLVPGENRGSCEVVITCSEERKLKLLLCKTP